MTTTTTTSTLGDPVHHARTRTTARATSVALAAALVLGGCTSADDEEPVGTRTTDGTTAPTMEPTTPPTDEPSPDTPAPADPSAPADEGALDAQPFPADTSPDRAEPTQDAMLTVVDVRAAGHEGYDRVVYEMDGDGAPGWTVEYTDQAVQAGSGNVIDIPGDGTLRVLITGSAYPMDSGAEPFVSAGPVISGDTQVVTEVHGWAVFEGITDSHIGLDTAGHPFRVQLLEDPVRVVVDVAHETS